MCAWSVDERSHSRQLTVKVTQSVKARVARYSGSVASFIVRYTVPAKLPPSPDGATNVSPG